MLAPDNPMRTVILSILIFEVIVFALAIPVMIFVSDVPRGLATGAGLAAALLALVSAGLIRKPVGYLLGWVTQVAGLGLGLLTVAMFGVGGLFTALWVVTVVLGRRLEAGRAGTG